MSLRIRKRVGPFTVGKGSVSTSRPAGRGRLTVGTRGVGISFRILPGVSLMKRWSR